MKFIENMIYNLEKNCLIKKIAHVISKISSFKTTNCNYDY